VTEAKLRALLPPGFILDVAPSTDPAAQRDAISDADYAVSADIAVDDATLRAARKLKLLHKWGVGIDNFALETARELNIKVARTTGSNSVAVAETALALMLAVQRQIARGHTNLQQGRWLKSVMGANSFLLSGKTVGIIGFGMIGQALARLLRGFDCRILYSKRVKLDAAAEQALVATHVSLDALLAEADIVSLHCPLTPDTRGLIGQDAFARMKPGAVLINVARGGIVIEADLIEALRTGKLRAAATDVYDVEPPPPDHPLLHMENVVVTPHCAALAQDNFTKTVQRMFHNMQCVSRGEPLPPDDVVVA
jgi:phosphoglycerate dehydrogenase-like enzyme